MLPGRRLALAVFVATAGLVGALAMACGLTLTGDSAGPSDAREAAVLPPVTPEPEPSTEGGPPPPPDAGGHVSPCPADAGLLGATMIESPASDFCIDSTEATTAQYRAFLDAGPSIASKLPPGCPSTLSFDPSPALPLPDAGREDFAVRGVSFCDAFAFCRWAGKRVCGGQLATDAGTAGEWFRACTNDGTQPVPYGAAPSATACTFGTDYLAGTSKVGKATCEGGYSGVFDLLGNAAEWVDSCDGANCTRAGGFWTENGLAVRCTERDPVAINFKSDVAGIRCCR